MAYELSNEILSEEAGSRLARSELFEGRHLFLADGFRVGAARVKTAAGRRKQKVRGLAVDGSQLLRVQVYYGL